MDITTTLTQEQIWGVQYVLQYVVNPEITRQNEALEEADKKPLYTIESYIQHTIGVAANSYYDQLLKYKEDSTIQMFKSMTPEQQAAVVAQLGIPDVL